MFRIRKPKLKKGAPVVYFMHGIVSSSRYFVVNGKDNSPAFIAAEAGYDVWLGDNRGNYNSRKHKWLDPDSYFRAERFEYWDHSF